MSAITMNPQVGVELQALADYIAGNYLLYCALFVAPTSPSRANVFADFTPPSFSGYAHQPIISPVVTAVDEGGGVWSVTYPVVTFTPGIAGAGDNVYGYLVYASGISLALWCELFSGGPVLIGATTVPYTVTPARRLQDIP